MQTVPASIKDLISRWRFISDFASDVGCGYEAARQMAARESIAIRHWSGVIAAAERRGIPGVSLEWMAAQRGVVSPVRRSRARKEVAA